MAQWEKLSFVQKTCVTSTGKLMQEAGMLFPGARVGVAVSGGSDSFTLLNVLMLRQRILPIPIELMVLHIIPGFDPTNHAPLVDFVREHGLAAHIEVGDHGPRAHSLENRKNSACFFCCRHRRLALFRLVTEYKLTHIAFGHNSDDLAVTFFLNLFQTGRVDGMSMRESYFGGEFELIRPFLWLDKESIAKSGEKWGLPIWENPCPTAKTSRRAQLHKWLLEGPGKDIRTRQNIYNGLRRWELDRVLNNSY